MMHRTEFADSVKEAILAAFKGTPAPDDDELVVDPSSYDLESSEVASAFRSKEWMEVTVGMVHEYKEALPLFTPTAFRYYLPAYMIACVVSYYAVDVALDSVIFNLTPPSERSGWKWDFFWARTKLFSRGEREAILLFLKLMEQYEIRDWATEGKVPPEKRLTTAVDFWSRLSAGNIP